MANEEGRASKSEKTANMTVREMLPVCLQLCEPVCAQSEYQITVSLLGNTLATIAIKGLTRLSNCEK
jgi:hypothetical protein